MGTYELETEGGRLRASALLTLALDQRDEVARDLADLQVENAELREFVREFQVQYELLDQHFTKAAAALEQGEVWVCEQHPWLRWPDGDCAGPGMLLCAIEHRRCSHDR